MMRFPTGMALTLAFLVTAASLPAAASKAVELGTEQLTLRAELVARGSVLSSETVVSRDGRRFFTLVRVRIEERWKGSSLGEVTVRVPGGERDGLRQVVQGMPSFEAGERVVLFLEAEPGPTGTHSVVGMAQGKYSVVEDPQKGEVVVRDLRGLELVPPPDTSLRVKPLVLGPLSLEQLRRDVLETLQSHQPAPPVTPMPRELP